jgi:hypothetical protein
MPVHPVRLIRVNASSNGPPNPAIPESAICDKSSTTGRCLRAVRHTTGVRSRSHQQVRDSHSLVMVQPGPKSLAQTVFTVPRYGTSGMHDSTRTQECQGYCHFRHHCRRRIGDARCGCPRGSGAMLRTGRRFIIPDRACRLRQWRRPDRRRIQPHPRPGRTKWNQCDTKSKPRRMREYRARQPCLRRD